MARRSFPCGHSGKGQYCHRCKQAEQVATKQAEAKASQLEERRADKQAWEATFAADPVDLRVLQTRERVTKARELLARLAAGEPYTALGGKRWESDRNIVSIPIGWGYRLVLRDDRGSLRALACMTHEAYNSLKPGTLA